MIFVGDVHGKWEELAERLGQLADEGETIVQVGDFGIGFDRPERERQRLAEFAARLRERYQMLYAIRGNHDDPVPFAAGDVIGDAVHLLPDYSWLEVEGLRLLCVGGATSVDRVWRRRKRLGWWPDEVFGYREGLLTGGQADIIVTHTAPSFCPPHRFHPIVEQFARHDAALIPDLQAERAEVTRLHENLDRQRLRLWVYGHFHARFQHHQAGVAYHGLAELDVVRARAEWAAGATSVLVTPTITD